ncbi:hypothetical protein [Pseudacidobacterium ailaaui]|jgi:hypothetical protein|uniref:hypothetical protein n=1 Tax=Pseudacidobacterium ailaaui TaxID=1382359 RepID=UPI00047A9E10|nr:hypothetical protein [Pseudacidobacterium ailaaui]MBX6360125.1 hypothetical protein [Pseudacidobacterium ailaaui]MCL6464382.1 hypothetical protein [Pseudacidobacterium ailaaui]MDI3254308.1 hypothetical protein [Bacillota bacterium]
MSRRLLHLFCIVLLCVCSFVPRAYASSSRVSFFHDIKVSAAEETDDLVCFFCTVHADGKINGDVVSFFGGVLLNNTEASGDVVSFFGPVKLNGDAHIGGDCVVFGAPLDRSDDASINGDSVQLPLVIFVLPVIILVLILYGLVALIRRRKYSAYPPYPPIR